MEKTYKYNAFISYRHLSPDKEIADRLQKKLESYKPPKALSDKKSGKWRIFRDETELPTSSNLGGDIKAALENSEFLIVICSPNTKESRWCMEEIDYFKKLHNGNNSKIITVVADGNPEDVFPPSLCSELIPVTDKDGNVSYQSHIIEPLAANVSGKSLKESVKKLNSEFLRIAAPLLGCGYDSLYNREHRKKVRRIITVGSIAVAAMMLFVIYNSAMLWQINNQKTALAKANNELDQTNQSLLQSYEELEKKTHEAESQRNLAQANAEEAQKQKELAEENLAEANRQQAIAEENADKAETQKAIAEENMLIAQENEARANEANRNLQIKNSKILADQAKIYLDNDDIYDAVKAAIDAIPEGDDLPSNALAEYVLATATNAYDSDEKMVHNAVKLPAYVENIEFSSDGKRIVSLDVESKLHIIDYDGKKLVKTFTPLELFGKPSVYSAKVISDGKSAFVLSNDKITSVDVADASINWRFEADENLYFWADEIISNSDSDYIFLPGSSSYLILDKQGKQVKAADLNSDSDYVKSSAYMDSDGNTYLFQTDKKIIYVISPLSNKKIDFDFNTESEFLSACESEEYIYVNFSLSDGEDIYATNRGKLVCFNKKDMSVKWQTEYNTNVNISTYGINKIFPLSHNLPNSSGEYERRNGIVYADSQNVLAFDIETGELYFKTSVGYSDRIIYCEPSRTVYGLEIGTPKSFYNEVFLANKYILGFTSDDLWLTSGYSFNEEIDIVDYAGGSKFVLVTKNSSELDLYYKQSFNHHKLFDAYPNFSGTVEVISDNQEGIMASLHSVNENGSIKKYLVIYDTINNKVLSNKPEELSAKQIIFSGNKLFLLSGFEARVIDYNGNLLEKIDLEKSIKEAAGYTDNDYISSSLDYYCTYKSKIVLCYNHGMYTVDISSDKAVVQAVMTGSFIYESVVSNKFVTFLNRYNDDRIRCFSDGDSRIYSVKENGEEAVFARGSIVSLVNTDKGNKIAFINKEGYIGITSYGDDSFKKLSLSNEKTSPIKIRFTPDGLSLIALCSNGDIIRLDAESGEILAEAHVDFTMDDYAEIEFMDESSFYIKRFSTTFEIFDIDSLQKLALVNDFVHYIKSERKLVFRRYIDGKYVIGYYEYKTAKELVEFAKEFLKNN